MNETQLLCTFTNFKQYKNVIEDIIKFYKIVFNKVYVLQNFQNKNEIYLTYNIESQSLTEHLPKTISVHRKKEFNVLYTINALNEIVKQKNNGVADKNFKIDWNEYRNSIIINNEQGIKVIPTKIVTIVNI